jgi:hypothetical protein
MQFARRLVSSGGVVAFQCLLSTRDLVKGSRIFAMASLREG